MEPHVKPNRSRRERICPDRFEPSSDDGLFQDEGYDEHDRDREEHGIPDAPNVSACDCSQQCGRRPRNTTGNGEHSAVDQCIHADRGDDRVEPHEADQHAIHDSRNESAAQSQQHRVGKIGAVAGRNMG